MTRLSALQYPALKIFAEGRPTLPIAECQRIDQRAFRSFLIRKYIAYTGRGFKITEAGIAAWDDFRFHGCMRKNPTLPLTAYFDAKHYGITYLSKRSAA